MTTVPAAVRRPLADKLASLHAALASLDGVVVAFSGGTDSALVLAAAATALGPERVVAATAVSASLPAVELSAAADFARRLGVRHETPATGEMGRSGYRANAGDRCYFCKAELMDTLGPLAARLGMGPVATGTNADDVLTGFRPGIRAASERGALTPLLDAGLTKHEIREASRERGLSTWDKPAAACLSSRVAFGIEITPARLARIEQAESSARAFLDAAGIPVRNLRVRDVGDIARLEVDAELVSAVEGRHAQLSAAIRGAGFDVLEVDPRGFRSGAMNELLAEPGRWR